MSGAGPVPAYPLPLPLLTDRLAIRGAAPDDVDAVLETYGSSAVSRYLYTEPFDRAESEAWVASRSDPQVRAGDGGANLMVVERTTRVVVGTVYVTVSSAEHRQAEVGWTLHPDHTGRGYATESARAVVDLAFSWGMHRVAARADVRNLPSLAVMQRLGMRHEGTLRENEWVKGEWTDEVVFALLDREWDVRGAALG